MSEEKKSSTDSVKVHVSWSGRLYVDPDELRAKIRARAIQALVSEKLKKGEERPGGARENGES